MNVYVTSDGDETVLSVLMGWEQLYNYVELIELDDLSKSGPMLYT